MTDEQINAAIWTFMGLNDGDCYCDECRPHYTQDLNAMHEAEKYIPQDIWYVYVNQLALVTGAEDSTEPSFLCATARQRAEAFLRTLGKWEEAK